MDVFSTIGRLSAVDSLAHCAQMRLGDFELSQIVTASGLTLGDVLARIRHICQETGAALEAEYNGKGKNF